MNIFASKNILRFDLWFFRVMNIFLHRIRMLSFIDEALASKHGAWFKTHSVVHGYSEGIGINILSTNSNTQACCWVIYNFTVECVIEISMSPSYWCWQPLDMVDHVYGFLDIIGSAQEQAKLGINLCVNSSLKQAWIFLFPFFFVYSYIPVYPWRIYLIVCYMLYIPFT